MNWKGNSYQTYIRNLMYLIISEWDGKNDKSTKLEY